jgi:hypothetical protein
MPLGSSFESVLARRVCRVQIIECRRMVPNMKDFVIGKEITSFYGEMIVQRLI